MIDDLTETIRDKSMRINVNGDVVLGQIAAYMTQVGGQSASVLMTMMSREQLAKFHGMIDGSNGDVKTTAIQNILFRDALAELSKKGKTIVEMKGVMFDITNVILTREFGDGTAGKIMWKTMKSNIDTTKGDMDKEAGREAARAEARAEAEV